MASQMTAGISTPRPRAGWWRLRWVPAGIVACAIAALLVAQLTVTSPSTVKRITLRNDSAYDLLVTASGADRDGVTSLGMVIAHSSTEFDDVIDQGDRWIFHFEGQARDGGEVRFARRALAGNGWKVTIPDAVAERLRAAGATPSPSQTGR